MNMKARGAGGVRSCEGFDPYVCRSVLGESSLELGLFRDAEVGRGVEQLGKDRHAELEIVETISQHDFGKRCMGVRVDGSNKESIGAALGGGHLAEGANAESGPKTGLDEQLRAAEN